MTSASPFKSAPEVGYEDAYELAWEVGFGEAGTTDDDLAWKRSRSEHELYLTYKAEASSYETVFHISCTKAKGKKTDPTVVEGVWSGFSGRDVKRKDGVPLTYYKSYLIKITFFEDLLRVTDGQCGAWARFFIETLRIHGISSERKTFVPTPPAIGFIVKTWSFAKTGTSGDSVFSHKNDVYGFDPTDYTTTTDYIWAGVAEVIYTSGTQGQNNKKPASLFGNHQIVDVPVGNAWYDPSYGLKHTTMKSIENTLSGFVKIGNASNLFFSTTNSTVPQIILFP